MPYISVIIPAYNEEKYILQTLESIEKQVFSDYEVILVTNGCTDKTEELVKNKVNAKVRYLSLPKANVSVARNAGALNAQGEILLFLDADTQLSSDSLEKIKNEFQKELSIATTKVRPAERRVKYHLAMALKNFYNASSLYQGCSGALICRRKDFHEAGGYDPDLAVREHRKLILELKKKGKYGCINTYVTTSMRRYEQWGLSKGALFWAKKWFEGHFNDLKGEKYEKIR